MTRHSLILMFVVVGCAKPTPMRLLATAEGEISYAGEPVPTGIVTFLPVPEDGRPIVGGPIIKGRYVVASDAGLSVGSYRVEIRWGKATGEKIKDAGYGVSPDVFAEGLPAKYNAESELNATFHEGANTLDFILEK